MTHPVDLDTSAFGSRKPNPLQRAVIALARSTPLKRGTFRPVLSQLVSQIRQGPVDVTYQGALFRLYHEDSAAERGALFNRGYNRDELKFLRKHTPSEGTFVDIGAYVGTFALPIARHVGAGGRVIAIEPHPVSHARLAFNAEASRLAHILPLATAAGAEDGELVLGVDAALLGEDPAANQGVRVPMRHLAGILQECGVSKIDSLKIDVGGYEDRVLMPFFREAPMSSWPNAIVIAHLATNEWLDDCLDDMALRGYQVVGDTRNNTFLLRQEMTT